MKRATLVLALALCAIAAEVGAEFLWGYGSINNNLSSTLTRYLPVHGITAPASSETDACTNTSAICPTTFSFEINQTLTTTMTYTATLRAGGSDTDWSCVITSASANCTDTTGSCLAASTCTSIKVVPANSPTAARAYTYVVGRLDL